MSQHAKAIVFDFDYTLADSSIGVVECFGFALDELGLPMAAAEDVRRTIGLSLADAFRSLVDARLWDHAEEFVQLFTQRADQVMADRTQVFGTVTETLRALIARGLSLGIVSTKYRYRINAILQREGLVDSFDVVIGGEDVADHKPEPTGLLQALARLARSPSEVLYVGDSVTDAETAKRAAVPFVAVLSGVTPATAFADYEPAAILDNLCQLPPLVGG